MLRFLKVMTVVAAMATGTQFFATPASATQVTAFKQSVAENAARDDDIAAFYRAANYEPVWTGRGSKDRARRKALLDAMAGAGDHGLPAGRYDVDGLKAMMAAAKTQRDLGRVEVELSKAFLQYARDIQTGFLTPRRIDSGLVRTVPYRDRTSYLTNLTKSSPAAFMRALAPQTPEYSRLMKEKIRLERLLGKGGWGDRVPAKSLKPGNSGNSVAALRNRLIKLGYLGRSATVTYDASIQKAVQAFQVDHGLEADGVAGATTIAEINKTVQQRLQSVMVAMERERWLNMPRGKRHVLVNLTDFHARIIDDGKVTFKTRSVVGANSSDRRSPEFSDVMEHMIVNPTWHVPRSIAVKEYLPQMQANPNAAGHLRLVNASGQSVSRANIDFSAFNASNFPFDLKQPPSGSNALGLVKFMFPNKHNIYLHDTPAKSLFARESRAFSHGCIRLHQPFDFAYALLAKQSSDPQGLFKRTLASGVETKIDLVEHVPVHLIYRTAFTNAKGKTNYRRDVYGRDGRIWQAMVQAGVAMRAVRS